MNRRNFQRRTTSDGISEKTTKFEDSKILIYLTTTEVNFTSLIAFCLLQQRHLRLYHL